MKKYIKYLLGLMLFNFFIPYIFADSYGFYIDTDTKEVAPGGIVEVKIYVDSIAESEEAIDYFNTGISFDKNVFELANDSSDFDVKNLWYVGSLKKIDEGVFFNVFSYKDGYTYDETWTLYGDGKYDLLVSNIKLRVKEVESQNASIYVTTGYDDEGDERQVYYDTSVSIKINDNLKEKDNDTLLSTFDIDGVELEPKFDKEITDYYARVPYDKEKVTIDCTCEGNYCETDNQKDYALEVGYNIIKITVTAEDGSIRTYSFVIIREGKSDDSSLASITLKDMLGSPIKFDFDPKIVKYDINVKYVINKISYNSVCSGVNCSVDNENGEKELSVGKNELIITVTAEDGNTTKYTINIKRSEEEKSFIEKNLIIIIIITILVIGIIVVVILLIKNNKKQDQMIDLIDEEEKEK